MMIVVMLVVWNIGGITQLHVIGFILVSVHYKADSISPIDIIQCNATDISSHYSVGFVLYWNLSGLIKWSPQTKVVAVVQFSVTDRWVSYIAPLFVDWYLVADVVTDMWLWLMLDMFNWLNETVSNHQPAAEVSEWANEQPSYCECSWLMIGVRCGDATFNSNHPLKPPWADCVCDYVRQNWICATG